MCGKKQAPYRRPTILEWPVNLLSGALCSVCHLLHILYTVRGKKTTITPTIFGAVAQNVAAWATRRPGFLHTCGTLEKAQTLPPLTLFLITVPSDLLCEWVRTSPTAISANCSSPTYKLTHLKKKIERYYSSEYTIAGILIYWTFISFFLRSCDRAS